LGADERRPVAAILDGPRPPAWQARALELLTASPRVRVVRVGLVDAPPSPMLGRAHRALDRRLLRAGADPLATVDVPRFTEVGEPELAVWLAAAEPDFAGDVVRLRYGAAAVDVEGAFRAALASGYDVVEIEARLERAGAPPLVLARGATAVRPFSLAAGVDAALWRSAVLACRAAESPRAGEAAAPPALGAPEDRFFYARSLARWSRVLGVRLAYRRPWRVLVRERGGDPVGDWGPDEGLVRWEPGHSYADPFLFEHEGRHHLFCEHVRPGTGRGVVSHVELEPGRRAREPVPVLETDGHLSYPFVFAWRGEVWLIPEEAAEERVRLFRAAPFPRRWELESVLLDGVPAADTTLLERDGRWWLFTSLGPRGATLGEELHLFTAATPLGPWEPHPASPVVVDIRGGRSAGAFLDDGSRLIRPAQDASRRYGWAVSFREVVELTTEAYAEREVGRLEPGQVPGVRAVHTYARDSRFEAIDVRRREPRLSLRRAR
jgi:hypothetical protein